MRDDSGRVPCVTGKQAHSRTGLVTATSLATPSFCPTHALHDTLCQPGQRRVDV
ncbi:hypothetical protein [Cerasicoccus frondis]|uniref:hypothetical protein n=1 Tax=Cerasicoccus frondis TaxID=490090 RepID=UPI002852AF5C|nr:hypothetical protein [Cerasicoccus frondis]